MSQNNATKNTIIDRMLVYNPLELHDKPKLDKQTEIKAEPIELDIPNDYNGIIRILLTINIKDDTNIIPGGITQLNHFLSSYNQS